MSSRDRYSHATQATCHQETDIHMLHRLHVIQRQIFTCYTGYMSSRDRYSHATQATCHQETHIHMLRRLHVIRRQIFTCYVGYMSSGDRYSHAFQSVNFTLIVLPPVNFTLIDYYEIFSYCPTLQYIKSLTANFNKHATKHAM